MFPAPCGENVSRPPILPHLAEERGLARVTLSDPLFLSGLRGFYRFADFRQS